MDYESKLKKFIRLNGINAEHLHFKNSVHTVEDACHETGTEPDDFVKSICMVAEGRTIVALVLGSQRASPEKVAEALGIGTPKVATPEEALERTGYMVGGTPPFGYPATFLIDPTVMQKEIVYAGGGTPNALIRISPEEVRRVNNGMTVMVGK